MSSQNSTPKPSKQSTHARHAGAKTVPAELTGFTPVFDDMVADVGMLTALVFGAVWRFCQMEDGVCRASLRTLAERLGISDPSVMRHIKRLVKAGYLKDLTPKARNVPHVYKDTGKARIRIGLAARVEKSPHKTASQSSSAATPRKATASQSSTTATQSALKRLSKRHQQEKREETAAAAPSEKNAHAFAEIFHALSPAQEKRLAELEETYTPDMVTEAMREAADHVPEHPLDYVSAILKQWQAKGQRTQRGKQAAMDPDTRQARMLSKMVAFGAIEELPEDAPRP